MIKQTIALTAIALAAFGWQDGQGRRPVHSLKEESMTFEYTATANEAAIVFKAETEESLEGVEIRNSLGQRAFSLRAGSGMEQGISGFVVQTAEGTPESLMARFPAGEYQITGETADGGRATGKARLSHQLPLPPIVLRPVEGEIGVSTTEQFLWIADPEAAGYVVTLEQDDNDGLVVKLPPGTSSFRVPVGVLESGKETQFEVGAIGKNGNCTLVEVEFVTR